MPRASTVHAVIAIGIDLGKNTLHMIGLDSSGAIVLREKVSRGQTQTFVGAEVANWVADFDPSRRRDSV